MKKLLVLLLLSLGFMGTTSAGEVETNILKLKALGTCESCNLGGADLSGADLSGADIYHVNLSGANLSGANLRWKNFRGSDLTDADLTDALLENAKFSGATLCNTIMPWGKENSGC